VRNQTTEKLSQHNALAIFAIITVVALAADRITKNIAIEQLAGSPPVVFLPAFLDFALVYNQGGAFGLFEGAGILFVGVALVAVAAIIVYLLRGRFLSWPLTSSLALISAGALGNAYDRAASGAVPDFIHTLFVEFPVFNIADCCLTVGEIVLVIIVAVRWFGSSPSSDEAAS
jgi:signal peptidase II